MKAHRYCPVHRVCLDCGARAIQVFEGGPRSIGCPGGPETSVAAISHILAERKFKRGQAAYSKGFPA